MRVHACIAMHACVPPHPKAMRPSLLLLLLVAVLALGATLPRLLWPVLTWLVPTGVHSDTVESPKSWSLSGGKHQPKKRFVDVCAVRETDMCIQIRKALCTFFASFFLLRDARQKAGWRFHPRDPIEPSRAPRIVILSE